MQKVATETQKSIFLTSSAPIIREWKYGGTLQSYKKYKDIPPYFKHFSHIYIYSGIDRMGYDVNIVKISWKLFCWTSVLKNIPASFQFHSNFIPNFILMYCLNVWFTSYCLFSQYRSSSQYHSILASHSQKTLPLQRPSKTNIFY